MMWKTKKPIYYITNNIKREVFELATRLNINLEFVYVMKIYILTSTFYLIPFTQR